MRSAEDVKERLKRIQFDRWTYSGLDESVIVSHTHEDHDPTACMDVPGTVYVHVVHFPQLERHERVPIEQVDPRERGARIEKGLYGIPLYKKELERRYGIAVPGGKLHAAWWLFKTVEGKAMYVGELDSPEVELVLNVVKKETLSVVILPAYGEMSESSAKRHRFRNPHDEEELKRKVAELAKSLKGRGMEVWAVPHPIFPGWSDKTAWKAC